MTGTVRLTIRNALKEDKGKYYGKILRCPKEVTETSLKIEGRSSYFVYSTSDESCNKTLLCFIYFT